MNYSPVEERLRAFAQKPQIIIEVQVVAITMSWINLQRKKTKSQLLHHTKI